MEYLDKYQLSAKESEYLLKKNIVELVYNAGKFEGLNTTLLQTEEIIKYNRANGVSVDEVLTVVHLKHGFEFILQKPVGALLDISKKINGLVAKEDALFPGEIRTGSVEVSTLQGRYVPPKLTEEQMRATMDKIMLSQMSATYKALKLFLFISKNQLFWDGNKRTALLTANKVMFDYGVGLFSIPEQQFMKFNELLSDYYNDKSDANETIIQFMYDFCIFGIDY
ncbi:Fic family protein [Isobaculum melis]|uniref:Fic/DOC family protein n=1 Tax=Isobaculum melis TaxID=142588 RepID=A0A1H9SQ51_9LACT|nr:Fic family protein [Isobaculum melis]SER87096.1 Fic/DOC family protein [Isobaculum melis]